MLKNTVADVAKPESGAVQSMQKDRGWSETGNLILFFFAEKFLFSEEK